MNENQDPITAAVFNRYLESKQLMASKCGICDQVYIPPRAVCPNCHADELNWVSLSGIGKISAFTAVYIGPTFMNSQGYDRTNPYLTGIVELEEGVRISARLLGFDPKTPAEVLIGTPVFVDFVRIEDKNKLSVAQPRWWKLALAGSLRC